MGFKKYRDMGRIEQLRNSGRELLGRELFITVKRDGQNCCFYQNPNSDMIHIASHHMAIASDDMRAEIKATKEYPKIIEMFEDPTSWMIYFEHMRRGRGPTKIEKVKKYPFLILIDIYDLEQERYLSYNFVHQMAHKYKIPIVKLLDVIQPETMTELWDERDKWLKWCKRHYREGIVIKDYYSKLQTFAKEKIDLPKKPRKPKLKSNEPQYPIMPEEKIASAIEQAMAEIKRNRFDPKSAKESMPIIAKYVETEAKEHNCSTPRNFFSYYIEYLRRMDNE